MSTPTLVPNHHAHHPGFAGLSGLVAAVSFTVGREGDAALATSLTDLGATDHLVDVGCGPGVALRYAASRCSSAIGVDPSAMMLRVGRVKTRARNVRYVKGSAEALPVPDGAASVVWSLSTVHHWQSIDGGLREARRVLGDGGRFLVTERRVAAGATGIDSHGWTTEQADAFAACCEREAFVDVAVTTHDSPRGVLLAVRAVSP